MHRAAVIRKSPIVIVRDFIALQFCAGGLYFLAGTVAHYANIWRGLEISTFVPFPIAQAGFIFIAEVVLALYIFFAWYRQTVRIASGQLIYEEGLLARRRTVVPLDRVASTSCDQGIIGRLANYGTVIVRDRTGSALLSLGSIPEPRDFVAFLGGSFGGNPDTEPLRLLSAGENERLERKSTFRWDVKSNAVNRALEKAAVKTVAAFMNSEGGHLLLGVADDGSPLGLDSDIATLARKDMDGFETHFSNVLSAMLGPSFRQFVTVRPFEHEGKRCMLVSVAPSPRPAYVTDDQREEFFIRTGNGTTALKMSEAHRYIEDRFG
jgi:membrane protein YdbS with pleckstrin-like domain